MGVDKGQLFEGRDVFIDYPYEEVAYRWDHVEKKAYVCFYGSPEAQEPVPLEGKLFNDALLYGVEINLQEYKNRSSL